MKNKPEYITDDYQPSDDLLKWCVQMGIVSSVIAKALPDFIFWHKEKKVRRSNFNMAFKNWLKKEVAMTAKQESTIKRGSQSFADYRPKRVAVCNKAQGRQALDQLLGRKHDTE